MTATVTNIITRTKNNSDKDNNNGNIKAKTCYNPKLTQNQVVTQPIKRMKPYDTSNETGNKNDRTNSHRHSYYIFTHKRENGSSHGSMFTKQRKNKVSRHRLPAKTVMTQTKRWLKQLQEQQLQSKTWIEITRGHQQGGGGENIKLRRRQHQTLVDTFRRMH